MIKKKILYVITKSVWGGAQRYVYDLAVNLPKDRFEAVVVTGDEGLLVEKLREAGIRTIALEPLQKKGGTLSVLFDLANLRLLFRLIKIFREERPDIIHLNSSKVGGIGALAARIASFVIRHSSFVIFTVHGWPFKEDRSLLSKAIIWFFSWLSSVFQDKIILINTADFKTAEKYIPREKLALIYNGIGEIEFPERTEARKFLAKRIGRPLDGNALIIGTIAELTPNKGLEYLVNALAKSDFTINRGSPTSIIIGDGSLRKSLENRIISLGLTDKIFLAGFIPEAARYLKGFDIFTLPSLKEGLPYTIMEAMQAGLPVVASDVGGIPDLIEHKKSGYLAKPKDAKALSEAIQEALQDNNKHATMGTAAMKRIRTRFTLRDMIENTSRLYDVPLEM